MSEVEENTFEFDDPAVRNVIAHDIRVMQYLVTAVAALTTAFATIHGSVDLGDMLWRRHVNGFNATGDVKSFESFSYVAPVAFHAAYFVAFPSLGLLAASLSFAFVKNPAKLASLYVTPVILALPFVFPLTTYVFHSCVTTITLFCAVGHNIQNPTLWFNTCYEMARFFAIFLAQLMYLTFLQVLSNQIHLGGELLNFYRRNEPPVNNRRNGTQDL
uniref:Protein rolling stone n=1 Tax=Panagrellus redivivus TaxID=6233 RepID=A0A7E4UQ90_PANRE